MNNLMSSFSMSLLGQKSISFLMIAMLLISLSACGASNSNPSDLNEKERGEIKLLPPQNDQIYFGALTNFGDLEDQVSVKKIDRFDKLAGKPIAWSYFSNNWTEVNISNKHVPTIRYPYENIQAIHSLGKTPFVRLMPWTSPHQIVNYTEQTRFTSGVNLTSVCKKSVSFPHNETQLISLSEQQALLDNDATKGPCFNDFSMQNIIDGVWDDELRQWAKDSINETDDQGNTIPILVAFTVEMNGSWFPWSGIYNGGAVTNQYGDPNLADGPERYRDAYRHIIDLFRDEEAKHITWFFAPDTIDPDLTWMTFLTENWNNAKNYYPGDDYIDWIGITIYGAAGYGKNGEPWRWKDFNDELSRRYQEIKGISSSKPIAILETGVMDNHNGGTKSEWLGDMFTTILNGDYLNIKALTYWNTDWTAETIQGDKLVDLNIDSSDEALATFRQLISNPRFISELRFSE